MKIILLLFGLATITYGLPVSQNSDFKDGILVEDTRSNQDSLKVEEQEQFVPKSNLSEISTTTTNEIKDDSFNIETSPQIWETASDKVESDNAAWEPRDQLSTTTTTEKKEVIDVSTSKFSTPARSENKEHFDKKSEENIEIITKPTPDEIDHNQSSTTAEASFVDSGADIGKDERSPAPAITEQTPINIEDKTEEEFITEISTSFQTSTAEPELATTTIEPVYNEIDSATPISSTKPEEIDENYSSPQEVEQSTSISTTAEILQSETTTASEPDSKETESTTPGSDQALSSTNPGNDSTSFEENSSSHHAVEQSTSISTSNENEVSETTIANLPNKNDNLPTTIKEEPNSETTTMSHQIAGQELPIRSSEENDSTTGSTFEEETEKVTMGTFTATSSEHDISEVDAVEDTTTERVEEEIQIGQEVVTKVSEVLEVVTEDSTNIIPNLRNGDENNTPDFDAIHASNQTTAQSESYPEESSATTLKEDSQTTTFSSSIDWETSPAKDLNSTEPEIFTDSGNYQPEIEQETEVPSIEEDSANNDVQSNVQEDHDGKENRDGNESNGGNDYNDGNASNGGKDYNDGNESNNGNDYNDGNESNGDKDYNDGNDSNGGKDSHDGNDYNDGNDTKDGNDYNDGNDSKDGNDYNDGNDSKDGNDYNDDHGDNDKYDDNHAFQDNNKNKSDHKVINQVSGDNSNNKEDSETGLPMEQPKTGARVVNTVLVPSNNNQAQPDGHNFNHFFYNQFYPGVRSPFQTYPKVSIYPAWPPRYQSAQGSQHPLNFANNAFLNNFLVPSRQFSQQQKYSSL